MSQICCSAGSSYCVNFPLWLPQSKDMCLINWCLLIACECERLFISMCQSCLTLEPNISSNVDNGCQVVDKGGPQGSILSPLLFTPSRTHCWDHQFLLMTSLPCPACHQPHGTERSNNINHNVR